SDTPRPTDTLLPTDMPTATDTLIPTWTPFPLPTLVPSRTETALPAPTLIGIAVTDTVTPLPTLPPRPTQVPTSRPIAGSPVAVPRVPPTAVAAVATPITQPDSFGGGNNVNVGVGTIQFPPIDGAGRTALDFDTNPAGTRVVIDQEGNMTINGVPY